MTEPNAPSQDRLKALVVPREHGAWGILLVPLLVGGAVGLLRGGRVEPIALLLGAALSLFWLRAPLESLLGTGVMRAQPGQERRHVISAIAVGAALSFFFLAVLLPEWNKQTLLLLGGVTGISFLGQGILKKMGRSTRMTSQIVGAVGLTVTAPAAYYVATGRLDALAFGLWLATFLFSAIQVYFVQLRIHGSKLSSFKERIGRGTGFLIGEVVLMATLLLAVRGGWLTALNLFAFAPAVLRATAWFFQKPKPLNVNKLGWGEVRQSLAFGVLLVFSVYWAR
jgi:hypothetical protein